MGLASCCCWPSSSSSSSASSLLLSKPAAYPIRERERENEGRQRRRGGSIVLARRKGDQVEMPRGLRIGTEEGFGARGWSVFAGSARCVNNFHLRECSRLCHRGAAEERRRKKRKNIRAQRGRERRNGEGEWRVPGYRRSAAMLFTSVARERYRR